MEKKLGKIETPEEEKVPTESEQDENKQDEKNTSKNIPSRFAPLLVFAEDDEDAAYEIYTTVKQELAGYQESLAQALKNVEIEKTVEIGKTVEIEKTVEIRKIGKIAHKLLPIATMIKLDCLEQIKALSPEHIQELDAQQIKAFTQTVAKELKEILELKQ